MTTPNYPSQPYPSQPQQYSPPPPPPSNVGWAVAAVIFFWPLAFSAFTHALNVFPRWSLGDYAGAQHASARAKKLGQISLVIFAILMVLMVIFYIIVIVAAVNSANEVSDSYNW